jgi:hypothetical protein
MFDALEDYSASNATLSKAAADVHRKAGGADESPASANQALHPLDMASTGAEGSSARACVVNAVLVELCIQALCRRHTLAMRYYTLCGIKITSKRDEYPQ